jgi:hypothetical protein
MIDIIPQLYVFVYDYIYPVLEQLFTVSHNLDISLLFTTIPLNTTALSS